MLIFPSLRIIDWGFAAVLPVQLALRLPRFLAKEPTMIDSPLPDNIPAFAREFLQPSSHVLVDRQFLMSYLSSLISNGSSQDASERGSLARCMKVLVSDPDVDWRYLLVESCSSKGFHTWLAKRSWLLHGTKGSMAGLVCFSSGKMVDEEVSRFLKHTDLNKGFTRETHLETVKKQMR